MNLTQDNIDTHFRINRDWKALFNRYYSTCTPADYVEKAWKIFEANGYTYEIKRYSDRPTSRLYMAVKEMILNLDGEEVVCYGDLPYSYALEQLLIGVICDFDVDFKTFK